MIKCNLYCGLLSRFSRWVFLPSVVGLGRAFERKSLSARLLGGALSVAFKRARKVYFQNQEDCESFAQQGVIRAGQGVVTPGSGVNLEKLRPTPLATNGSDSQKNGTITFMMFGRLIPAKGFDFFLEAAGQMKEVYGDRVTFWIAGGLDGSDEGSKLLLERIHRAQEAKRVHYWGHSDSVLDIVQQASIVVLPSTYNEGVPRSLLEGLALAKPIITTDWKGCRDTVNPIELNGYLVAPKCLGDLVSAMKKFVDLGSEERQILSQNSRRFAEERFSEKFVLDKYLSEVY